jgi:MFS family permease
LITTAVSAELGTLVQSKSALATVSAIIDGTGSIGAAVGPSIAGIVSEIDWKYVFYLMMLADLLAMLSLVRIAKNEWSRLRARRTFPTFSENSNDSLYRSNTMSTVNTLWYTWIYNIFNS